MKREEADKKLQNAQSILREIITATNREASDWIDGKIGGPIPLLNGVLLRLEELEREIGRLRADLAEIERYREAG